MCQQLRKGFKKSGFARVKAEYLQNIAVIKRNGAQ